MTRNPFSQTFSYLPTPQQPEPYEDSPLWPILDVFGGPLIGRATPEDQLKAMRFAAKADQPAPAPKTKQKPTSKMEEHKRQEKQQQAELKRHFEEAVGTVEPRPVDRVPETSRPMFDGRGQKVGYMDKGIFYDVQGNIVDELPLEEPDWYLDPVEYVGGGTALRRLWKKGSEIPFGKDLRIAPFGNRTGNKYGQWPHYHRRDYYQEGKRVGQVRRDQGIDRHRPWEPRDTDKTLWDKF